LSKPTDLVQGTLDLLILEVLALEPMHGWASGRRVVLRVHLAVKSVAVSETPFTDTVSVVFGFAANSNGATATTLPSCTAINGAG
jgi:hypothetical protein